MHSRNGCTVKIRTTFRNGHYPERILADKIYRNRANLSFCREHGIRLSGPALGRLKETLFKPAFP